MSSANWINDFIVTHVSPNVTVEALGYGKQMSSKMKSEFQASGVPYVQLYKGGGVEARSYDFNSFVNTSASEKYAYYDQWVPLNPNERPVYDVKNRRTIDAEMAYASYEDVVMWFSAQINACRTELGGEKIEPHRFDPAPMKEPLPAIDFSVPLDF